MSKIEKQYGTPLPISLLWLELTTLLTAEQIETLQANYRRATRRYAAACRLHKFTRIVEYWKRHNLYSDRIPRYQAYLDNPQEYIDNAGDREDFSPQ